MNSRNSTIWITLFVFVLLSALAAGCNGMGAKLSERGQEELSKHIEELAGNPVEFEIVSIVEAPGYSDGEQQIGLLKQDDGVSGCPDDAGGRNMWCVVLDREVVSRKGEGYSHFLVQNLSGRWYVEELDYTEREEFAHLGCQNWDEALASSQ